jgi:serine/threonine-protein kinase
MPKVGKYHIARKIADGGMAEIFLGTQHGMEGFERPVVLKRILAPLVADPQFRNMLIDEAHVAMGLNHSNIVQVLDLGHVRGRYFLVMELVDGWDLSQILARAAAANFPLPPEVVLYIAAEICRALAYAHARTRDGRPLAIVHRDVSPQNVLVSEQGEVKLTDFGIAKAMGRRERTNQGVIKGKLAFMSPEQASGSVLDNRSDLFALGTMLYQFFTGRRPFEAPTDLEAIMRVRECKFTPPEAIKPSLHPALVKILRRAMQALPSNRYQSADEMLGDIESVQRTVYKPAGQTELKRWLAELQERDHCPTISKATPAQATTATLEELDIGEGADVVFDESSLTDVEEIMRGMQPTIAAEPEQLTGSGQHQDAKTTAQPPSTPAKKSSVPARVVLLSLVIAALAGGAWWVIPGGNRKIDRPDKHLRASAKPVPTVTKDERLTAATVPSPPPPPPPLPAAAVDAGVKPSAEPANPTAVATTAPAEADEDEEKLLKSADPADQERVIDEDEGVQDKKKPAKVRPAAPAAIEPTSVHIVSVPEGAVIRLGKRVFGRAPMNLRFRPGITFELTFVKRGYLPASKNFTPTGRKNQSVRVVLRKKPQPRKSFFRRIFGRK